LIFIIVAVGGCAGKTERKNVCPIDGQAPEWSKQIDARNCEYFHFSAIEPKPTRGQLPANEIKRPEGVDGYWGLFGHMSGKRGGLNGSTQH